MKDYRKVVVNDVSFETFEDDGELFGDMGAQIEQAMDSSKEKYMLSLLTNKQRTVAEMLLEGYKRKEIARKLGITIQAVHQIVPRIRKRMLPTVTENMLSGERLHDNY